jgi:PA14 domain
MKTTRIFIKLTLGLTLLSSFSLVASQAWAQKSKGLPPNWKELPPEDLVEIVRKFYDPAHDRLDPSIDGEALREHAAMLLTKMNIAESGINYQTLDAIHWAAKNLLSEEDKYRLRNEVMTRQDQWKGRPFEELRSKLMLMWRLGVPLELRTREGRRWAQAGGKLSEIPVKDLPDASGFFADQEGKSINGDFSVSWVGNVVAPKTGDYTFSISPINVNSDDFYQSLSVTTAVTLAGKQVIAADAQKWNDTSRPIHLEAGQSVPIKVDWSAHAATAMRARALHAILYWQGPGIAKSIVPAANLRLPDGKTEGLKGTYRWEDKGQQQTLTHTDQNLDLVWGTVPFTLFGVVPEIVAEAAAHFWAATTSDDYLTWCENSAGHAHMHPILQDPDSAVGTLSSEQRKEFLQTLLSRPALLDPLTPRQGVRLYSAFRFGNPDLALAVFGKWALRHADQVCDLRTDQAFDDDARGELRRLAVYTTHDMPGQAERLQREFLVLADGRCCLPVAYALAYSHLSRGTLGEWAALLDRKLNDKKSPQGDLRVNWLLARALAEELKHAQPDLRGTPYTRTAESMRLLEEARRAAQAPTVKVRVGKECVARLVALREIDKAEDVLQEIARITPPSEQEVVGVWMMQVGALKSSLAEDIADQPKRAQQAYIETLKQRRDQAAKRKDQQEVKRYEALISAAEKSQ